MKVIDLFSGCGGLSLGFQNAGFGIEAAFDNWTQAVEIYRNNFKHPIFETDLSKINDFSIFTKFCPDMMIGGTPCQDFSSAGKRNEDNGKGDLTISYAQIIANVKPEWFVMENVERITKTKKLSEVKEIFKESGYGLSSVILDASYCNVPQIRKRFFLIGHLCSPDNFLDHILIKKQSKKALTVFGYLGNSLGIEHYYRHPRSYERRAIFSIYEPSPTIRGVNRPIPKNYRGHKGDTTTDIKNIRPLTTIERSYIQTFPVDFKFFGIKTDLEQIIGNAVPVNLGRFVADCINEYICTHSRHIV